MGEKSSDLAALEAHGLAFLQSFGISGIVGVKRAAEEAETKSSSKKSKTDKREEFAIPVVVVPNDNDASPALQSRRRDPDVVVFHQLQQSNKTPISKASRRSFMSSKVSRVVQDPGTIVADKHKPDTECGGDSEDEQDRSNAKNDAELHRLLHTRLLSAAVNTEVASSTAQRKKALQGRVLELANRSKLGHGEKDVRATEHKKAAKHIRIGMKHKQKKQDVKQLEEAKNVGNYHPTLKKLFGSSSDASKAAPKRDRGLSMGIGRHTSSGLRLSKDEIATVNGPTSSGSRPRKGGGIKGKRR